MNMNLSPQKAENKVFEGEGGSFYSWSSSKFPLLGEAKVGAGRLLLHPRGFALPHYTDSSKIGYVLQGSGTVGMVFPNTSEEEVLTINKGDAVPVPIGVVSWWFNGGDTDLVVIFIGETSKTYIPGDITYFLLTGTLGVLKGFSNEFIRKAYNMTGEEATMLVTSQTGSMIIKLEEGISVCRNATSNELIANIENAMAEFNAKNGGYISDLTSDKFPLLEEIGLSAKLENLDANGVCSPMYPADSSVQVTYIVKGSGRVQFSGINGEQALNAEVQAGDLFVVPRFFVAMKIAGGEGMECFSVITSSQPVFGKLSGNTSVWKALSPSVLQTSLGVTPEFAELFITKN